ncbi:hypothetical protein DYB32_008822 [Aphanomyces invadans]|uniref:Peptidase A2 domain-containing protein n=1 Tax=Aphanomyces invadans TaxID=157072 RepID=A0A418ALR9_9STRA|nr:hypothetical protein DYB32_008822 [Aphanomyces invadans]
MTRDSSPNEDIVDCTVGEVRSRSRERGEQPRGRPVRREVANPFRFPGRRAPLSADAWFRQGEGYPISPAPYGGPPLPAERPEEAFAMGADQAESTRAAGAAAAQEAAQDSPMEDVNMGDDDGFDHQEWVLHEEGKIVVEIMTKASKPEVLKTVVQKQLQLQRNKGLKSDVFRYVKWLRQFSASFQLYVSLDEVTAPALQAGASKTDSSKSGRGKPDGADKTRGRPDGPEKGRGRSDGNGRADGRASGVEKPAVTGVKEDYKPKKKLGCLKCGDKSHYRGALDKGLVRVENVLLDTGADVNVVSLSLNVVSRGVIDALAEKNATVAVQVHDQPRLVYPYGVDIKPLDMKRHVKFGMVTLDTTCGPLTLRGLQAWIDETSTAMGFIVSRPVMEVLGFSIDDLLDGARRQQAEWEVSPGSDGPVTSMSCVQRLSWRKNAIRPSPSSPIPTAWRVPRQRSKTRRQATKKTSSVA